MEYKNETPVTRITELRGAKNELVGHRTGGCWWLITGGYLLGSRGSSPELGGVNWWANVGGLGWI